MKIYFLDTNIFIQCKELKELPWQDIADGDNYLLLLVPRPVAEEIDQFKQGGNVRRSKRARKASSLLRELVLSDNDKLVIRESAPHVEIAFPPELNTQYMKAEGLDLARTDDRIIYEAMKYADTNTDKSTMLLTHDTNPLLTAKKYGLPFQVIPDEWLLAPEPDSRDKELTELKRRLQEIEKCSPQIQVIAKDTNNSLIDSYSFSIAAYDKLSEKKVEELIEEMKKRNPVVSTFNIPQHSQPNVIIAAAQIPGFGWDYQSPDEKVIKEYQEVKYPQWLDSLKHYFTTLHLKLGQPEREVVINFELANLGNVPAENIVIEFEALGGLYFKLPSVEEDEESCSSDGVPDPPAVPEGKLIRRDDFGILSMDVQKGLIRAISPRLEFPHIFNKPFIRDRNKFYWKDEKPCMPSKQWSFICDEFRHQVGPEKFEMKLIIPPKTNIEKACVRCFITAKNLPQPVEYMLPIKVHYVKADIEEQTDRIIGKEMPHKAIPLKRDERDK